MPAEKTKPKPLEAGKAAAKPTAQMAVIRIRGSVSVHASIRDTMNMLRLNRVNHCVIVPGTPAFRGMLRRAMNYLTWGEINPETLEALIQKRGRLPGGKRLEKWNVKRITEKLAGGGKDDKIKPVFRLSPPSKGFKSIRRHFPKGDLGYRGGKINDLLKRMI